MARNPLIWLGVLTACAAPAQAECLGGCLDGLAQALASAVVYFLIVLAVTVMLLRAKWRRAGFWALGIFLVVAIGVPLLSQGWHAWNLRAMIGREVNGQPPRMADRRPLLIPLGLSCYDDPCTAVLYGVGNTGVYVLPAEALEGQDLRQPLRLADLPLELWVQPAEVAGEVQKRHLTAAERQEAALKIDYLILSARPYYLSEPGALEAALQDNPALRGMGSGEVLNFAMAPIEAGQGSLSLADLRFDLLDLWLASNAFALPLAPGNRAWAGNESPFIEAAARSICPLDSGEADWFCLEALR